MPTFNDRTGERFKNRDELGGYEFIIVEYNNYNDLWIEFQDKYRARVHTSYAWCKKGIIKNPYHPSVLGVGFIGQGKYKATINNNKTKCYTHWQNMLERCYDSKLKERLPTYIGCSVCEEAHCLQDFGEWFDENYYEIEGEQMCLDKDILVKGNKEYRFDRMVFVPQRINVLFVKGDAMRGDLPIGVCYNKKSNKYQAYCKTLEHLKYLGYYDTPHEAFLAYKTFKEQYIKQVADEYKGKIPDRLYDAMYAWEVEEDD